MLDIYLCEDNRKQLQKWKKIVENYILMSVEECALRCAVIRPQDLLTIRKEFSHTGLYFLDIDLQSSIDGLELAQEIRKLDPRGYIVFITTHSEMNMLTFRYKIEAMDFILKDEADILPHRICDCIKTAIENQASHIKNNHHLLTMKGNGDFYTIDQNDVVCIKTTGLPRKIVIHTTYGIYQVNGVLKELSEFLEPSFFQCSRSTIVKLERIKEYQVNRNLLILDNNEAIQVSIRMAGKLKKLLKTR